MAHLPVSFAPKCWTMFAFVCLTVAAQPSEKPPISELDAFRRGTLIRDKLVVAYGGADRLARLVTLQRQVEAVMTIGTMKLLTESIDYMDIRQPLFLSISDEGKNKVGFDGSRSWQKLASGEEPPFTLAVETFLDDWLAEPLVHLSNEISNFLFLKTLVAEGREFILLNIVDPITKESIAQWWVDSETSLVTKVLQNGWNGTSITTELSDYQLLEGIALPFKKRTRMPGTVHDVTFKSSVINPKLSHDFYKEPQP